MHSKSTQILRKRNRTKKPDIKTALACFCNSVCVVNQKLGSL